MKREIHYLNHHIILPDLPEPAQLERPQPSDESTATEGLSNKHVDPQHPDRDELDATQGEKDRESHEQHGGHGDAIILHIDGEEIMAHQMHGGQFHTHELPFLMFNNLEDLAKAVVNQIEFGRYHGHPQKSE